VLKIISAKYPESELMHSTADFLRAVEELLNINEQQLIDVWAEYTRLFIAPRPIAIPFEAIQRTGLFKDRSWEEVRKWFLEDGFVLEDKSVLEDHAGVELEYIAKTCLKSYELLTKGSIEDFMKILERQRKFMEEHIMKWIPRLCDIISQNSRNSFYKAFAKFAKTFLEEDYQLLNKLLAYLRPRD
jgi:TorA maturation chaperone TorD